METGSADFSVRLRDGLRACGASRRVKHLVAVSGGRDSVALLHGLIELGWKRLVVCHLDHGLRGRGSTGDARFVRRLAARLDLPVEMARADTKRHAETESGSIETAARELRHRFFADCARRHRCNRVLLAHHADDQIETCLFNLLRGTGAAGFAGMRARTDLRCDGRTLVLLRPLLRIRRGRIDAYLQDHGHRWREDATNADMAPTRNRMRHIVLPLLETEFGAGCGERILRTAEILRAEDDYLQEQVESREYSERLPVRMIADLPLALRRRVVRRWLIASGVKEPGFRDVEAVLALAESKGAPAKINLPGNRHTRRRAGVLFVE